MKSVCVFIKAEIQGSVAFVSGVSDCLLIMRQTFVSALYTSLIWMLQAAVV